MWNRQRRGNAIDPTSSRIDDDVHVGDFAVAISQRYPIGAGHIQNMYRSVQTDLGPMSCCIPGQEVYHPHGIKRVFWDLVGSAKWQTANPPLANSSMQVGHVE